MLLPLKTPRGIAWIAPEQVASVWEQDDDRTAICMADGVAVTVMHPVRDVVAQLAQVIGGAALMPAGETE